MYQAHFLSSGARPELKSKIVRRACQDEACRVLAATPQVVSVARVTVFLTCYSTERIADAAVHGQKVFLSTCTVFDLNQCESNPAKPKRLYSPGVVLHETCLASLHAGVLNLNLHANAANGACSSCTWPDQPAACLKKLRSLAHVHSCACTL